MGKSAIISYYWIFLAHGLIHNWCEIRTETARHQGAGIGPYKGGPTCVELHPPRHISARHGPPEFERLAATITTNAGHSLETRHWTGFNTYVQG